MEWAAAAEVLRIQVLEVASPDGHQPHQRQLAKREPRGWRPQPAVSIVDRTQGCPGIRWRFNQETSVRSAAGSSVRGAPSESSGLPEPSSPMKMNKDLDQVTLERQLKVSSATLTGVWPGTMTRPDSPDSAFWVSARHYRFCQRRGFPFPFLH